MYVYYIFEDSILYLPPHGNPCSDPLMNRSEKKLKNQIEILHETYRHKSRNHNNDNGLLQGFPFRVVVQTLTSKVPNQYHN